MSDEEKKIEAIEENEVKSGIDTGTHDVDISKEVKSAFLDYSMSVIVSRAIPDVYDGLKPVHRRIIYGMNELGITPDKPYKKSARIVGDVMGKYHPHGDTAIYDSLVRLAQPFSMRLPLVDGHGNFGSIDGDQAAAQRYTEARMNKLAMEMVRDLNAATVDFVDNYDGAEKEPVVLPARFPNLLVNGSSGIAVGMATNIPPHNLREVINALKEVVHNPEVTTLELMQKYLPGPDFPTGGLILGQGGIRKAYETGAGIIAIRGKTEIKTLANGKNQIIITEIPYQVNKANMVEAIARLVKDKIIDGITDIRDESNKDGIRVVIELRKEKVPEVVLNQLFKNSQLQVSFGIINLALIKGQPKVMTLIEMLNYYMEHQINVVVRRTKFLLGKALDRMHIVDGYIIAIENIDEVVKIIRGSQLVEEARKTLAERYSLSDKQTREIVDMPLRRLVGLEIHKLKDEKIDLETKIKYYNELLDSPEMIKETIISELDQVAAQFGDERRTEISADVSTIDDEDLIPKEEIVVTLTTEGYIKRMDPDDFQAQNRGGRGKRGLTTKENDVVHLLVHARTHTDLLFFSNLGKVYRIRGYQVPLFARTAKGLPINNVLNLDKDEKIRAIITVDEYEEGHYLFFVTTQGIVKKTKIQDFASIRQNGKIAISLNEGDHLLDVKHTDGSQLISIASDNGKLVKFNENDVRPMGRTAAGVKGMNVDGGQAISVTISNEGDLILVVSEHGLGKVSLADDYRLTKRGAKGVLTIKTTEKTGKLVSMRAVAGNEDLLIITTSGTIIRIPVSQINQSSRVTQGVIIVRPDEGHVVQDIALLPFVEEDDDEDNPSKSSENTAEEE